MTTTRSRQALMSASALVLITGAVACGSSGNDALPPTSSWQQGQTQQQTQKAPVLSAGQTLSIKTTPIQLATPIPAGSADVTLVSVTEAKTLPSKTGVTTKIAPDEEFAVLTFKVKNTGEDKFDTYVLDQARWTGEDGYAVNAGNAVFTDHEPGTAVPYPAFHNQVNPMPGEFVLGTSVLVIPATQPGTLHFTDRNGNPLFDVATKGK
ncbi:hypothetical protein ACFY7C_37045 [Streptomyces sp. NPDC012769]|uniref:hypothetical protein n=1 Tax=Streptomyces sp. NPDC012769 TaxID=3364848 RepID=UPI003684148D